MNLRQNDCKKIIRKMSVCKSKMSICKGKMYVCEKSSKISICETKNSKKGVCKMKK